MHFLSGMSRLTPVSLGNNRLGFAVVIICMLMSKALCIYERPKMGPTLTKQDLILFSDRLRTFFAVLTLAISYSDGGDGFH